jgi:hypothetical protein
MKMDVAISAEKGPIDPACISFSGRISKFTIKIPNGGIQLDLKMDAICIEPLHTY